MSKYKFQVGQRVKLVYRKCGDVRVNKQIEGPGSGYNMYLLTGDYEGHQTIFYESELTTIDDVKES